MSYGKECLRGVYDFPHGNREKCKNANPPTYRSSWELYFMNYLSKRKHILEWISEYPISYFNSVKNRNARYFVDFVIVYKNRHGDIITEMIEIKPFAYTNKPVETKTKKGRGRFIQENLTYMTNLEKWTAAQRYAAERGWEFRILTENQLFR